MNETAKALVAATQAGCEVTFRVGYANGLQVVLSKGDLRIVYTLSPTQLDQSWIDGVAVAVEHGIEELKRAGRAE